MEPSDQELIGRIQAGEARAYAALVERYYPRFLRYALRMLGNRSDAEEVVQDTFVRAYRALGRYEERQLFSAWGFRILVNQCRTAHARQRRRQQTFVPYDAALEGAEGDGGEPRAGGVWSREVQRALAELTPDLREALLLKYVEDQSYEEMAEATGAGISALKMRVKRAREQLKHRLRKLNNA